MNDDIKNITSAMPDHVINDALDTIFNGGENTQAFVPVWRSMSTRSRMTNKRLCSG
jgi:hypothetical protein